MTLYMYIYMYMYITLYMYIHVTLYMYSGIFLYIYMYSNRCRLSKWMKRMHSSGKNVSTGQWF